MGKELDLLRMLEPVVRPGNLPAPSRSATAPVEEQSFASLLETAKDRGSNSSTTTTASSSTTTNSSEASTAAGSTDACNPLALLAGPDRIENTALRSLLAQHREASNVPAATDSKMPA